MAQVLRATHQVFVVKTVAGAVKFDATRRYLRAGVSGARYPIVQGASMTVLHDSSGRLAVPRYSVNGYVKEQTHTTTTAVIEIDAGSFNASVTMVKIL